MPGAGYRKDMDFITLVIDGQKVRTSPGKNIIDAAGAAGITIPHLCYMPGGREPGRHCDLCMVEVEGRGRVRACGTPVEPGLVIRTDTPELEEFRRERLQILAASHYGDCKAPCNMTCPGGINVQGYVNLIAHGEYEAALRLIKEKNPLPVSVGRVCPRFCETRCRRLLLDEPIAINHLKRFVADYGIEHGFVEEVPAAGTGKRVAIIGGGPAGLSASYYLRKSGHEVTIFEARERLGGMLAHAIPDYKIPRRTLEREIQGIINMGVHVKTGRRWGEHFNIGSLMEKDGFDAVFIATGLSRQRVLDVEGNDLATDGLRFLMEVKKGEPVSVGRQVLVVGGGDIAIDAARCARRLGAQDVTVIYPRSRVELPAYQRDVEEAEREGVQFFLMSMPTRIIKEEGGLKVEMSRTVLGEPDERGIRRPVPMPGSRLFWNGDMVIAAPGQEGDASFQSYGEMESAIRLTSRNTIKSNPTTMKTSVKGVYAGGDVASGPRTVIQAVAAGRRAAEAIHEYITGSRGHVVERRFNFSRGKRFEEFDMRNFDGYPIRLSEAMPSRPPERRMGDFGEVDLGFTEEMARREAQRCLQCGCLGLSKCEYRELSIRYRINASRSPSRLRVPVDTSHPFIIVDPNKCVACERCSRTCEHQAIELTTSTEREDMDEVFLRINERCVSCGACVDACPTGALAKKSIMVPLPPGEARHVRTVCTYCGTGCSVNLLVKNGVILEARAESKDPPNNGDLCLKGRFGFGFYRHPDRLTMPLLRKHRDEPFRQVSWDEAIEYVAKEFQRVRERHGPDALGVLSSSRCENESNYLAQKFARAILGTNNIDNCARVCHAPSVSGLRIALGSGAATNPLHEIEGAEVLLVCGSNTTESHPVIGYKVKRAVKKGTRLIVIDPRRTELAAMADLWLNLKPGTNIPLLNAITHEILAKGLENKAFIRERTEGLDELREHLRDFAPDAVESGTGVPADMIRDAARMYAATRRGMILYGLGVTEHRAGTYGVMALANIALVTGNVGRSHAGICPLRGQNNVQGSCDMGALPYVYTGYQDVSDRDKSEKLERAWGCRLPVVPGLTEPQMYEAAVSGRFKGLYCIGYDPLQTQADTGRVKKAFERMDIVVVQDLFLTPTARMAHVVFPAACVYEKDGTYTNAERRIRRIRKAVEPPGQALPDWRIISLLATAMGARWEYAHPGEIMDEVARVTPSMAGVSYERLEDDGLVWPCPDEDHSGTPILHRDAFVRGKGRFTIIPDIPSQEQPDENYPLVLVTGRRLVHYNNGSMTRRCRGLMSLVPGEFLEIHPRDGARLGIRDEETVRVRSRRGSLKVRARLSERVRPGTTFMAFHFPDTLTNILTSPGLDEISLTPEYKVCAVAVDREIVQERQ